MYRSMICAQHVEQFSQFAFYVSRVDDFSRNFYELYVNIFPDEKIYRQISKKLRVKLEKSVTEISVAYSGRGPEAHITSHF